MQVLRVLSAHLKAFIGFELKSTNGSAKKAVTAYQLVGAHIAPPKDPLKREALVRELHFILIDSEGYGEMSLHHQDLSMRLDSAGTTFADLAPMLKTSQATRNLASMDAHIIRQT